MKNLCTRTVLLLLFLPVYPVVATSCTVTSSNETTIIILRHSEKDTAGGENPPLTVAGMQRAERLSATFPALVPDAFYSTNYVRTMATVSPWAKQAQKEVQLYDSKALPEFADMLKQQKGKTIVVAGHSNTVPQLVNFLIGTEKYKQLEDNEYDKIFVVKVKRDRVKESIITY